MTQYIVRSGDLAYFDSMAGAVPIKVIAVYDRNYGVTARVTANRKPYNRGDIINVRHTRILSRKAVTRSGRILGKTIPVPDTEVS